MEHSSLSTLARYINEHPLVVLSTVDASGKPHGSTLYVGSDEHLNIYFMTKTGTGKYTNIQAMPFVAITASGEDDQTTLQIHGQAIEVTDPEEGNAVFEVLHSVRHNSHDFRLPISKLNAGTYAVFRVMVDDAVLTEYEATNQINGRATVSYRRG